MKHDEFKKLLDDQEARLILHIDERLETRLEEHNTTLLRQMTQHMDEQMARFFGQVTKHVDGKVDDLRSEMTERFDRLEKTLDRDTKRTETDEQERVFLTHQVDRHEGWIRQLADNTGTKLAAEQ